MAWTDPGDFTPGQILTAAEMDNIREAMFFGQATFTNEAARDTAFNGSGAMSPITLQEGMRAYLSAPTVPAATGSSTMVPTGVTTVYNGSVWVCTTPVSASQSATGTLTSTSYTSTLSGSPGTNPTVTLVTGTTALVSISGWTTNSNALGAFLISVSVSGAGTVAGSDDFAAYTDVFVAAYYLTNAHTFVMPGLTAGTNTFALSYRVGSGTGTIQRRRITVQGIA